MAPSMPRIYLFYQDTYRLMLKIMELDRKGSLYGAASSNERDCDPEIKTFQKRQLSRVACLVRVTQGRPSSPLLIRVNNCFEAASISPTTSNNTHTSCFWSIGTVMHPSLAVVASLAYLTIVNAGQEPLIDSPPSKVLVSSASLENDIKQHNLLKRAEHLYKIAKTSEHEYNHPTRVIGSEGEFLHFRRVGSHRLIVWCCII